MKRGICKRGIPEEKVTVLPHGCNTELFDPADVSARPALPGKARTRFAAIYCGTMGFANGLDYVVRAAAELKQRGRDDIAIILQGSGGRRDALIREATDLGLEQVYFPQSMPRGELGHIVTACHATLLIFRIQQQSFTVCPQKLFDGLAAGRPILFNVRGWVRDVLEGGGCGRFVDPDDPRSLADALIALADDPALAQRMGARARDLAETEFSWDTLAAGLNEILHHVAGNGATARAESLPIELC
jgi:glycosyltransferase involved in cell wall biosynthesis